MTAWLDEVHKRPADNGSDATAPLATALTDAAMTAFGTLHRLELDRKRQGKMRLRSLLTDLDLFGSSVNTTAHEEYHPAG